MSYHVKNLLILQMDELTTQTSQQYKRSYTLTFIGASIIHHNRCERYHGQKHNEAQKNDFIY